MKIVTLLACICLMTFEINAQMFKVFTSKKHADKSNWLLGKLIFFEDFNDLKGWRHEGRIKVSNPDGVLKIETGSAFKDWKEKDKAFEERGNVWSVREFEGPFYFEWKFKDISEGLNLIFWSARTYTSSP